MPENPNTITALQAQELLQTAVYVDVRDRSELQDTGTIPGALHIPLQRILTAPAGGLTAELPIGSIIITICRSGMRSSTAAAHLRKSGSAARTLEGGILGWIASGYPVAKVVN